MLRPGDWKSVDPRTMDPETDKRLRSGFWRRDHDFERDMVTWTCDKRKLNDKIAEAMLDREFQEQFTKQGMSILDRLFGEGTANAFSHKGKERVSMRFFDDMHRENDMAYWIGNTTTSTSDTFTTAGSTCSNLIIRDGNPGLTKRPVVKQGLGSIGKGRLITKVPFKVEHGGSLLSSLQREFDRWAKPQMQALHG